MLIAAFDLHTSFLQKNKKKVCFHEVYLLYLKQRFRISLNTTINEGERHMVQTTNSEHTQSTALSNSLNGLLADWSVLGVKLHYFHWYVKGPHFFTLHSKFEELYTAAAAYVDEIAERLLIIGERPAATMGEYLKLASIEEAAGQDTAEEMVESLLSDLQAIAGRLQEGIETAGDQGDDPTADMLTGMKTETDKQAWMLRAFLGK